MAYNLTNEDLEFLKNYNITDYKRPSVATDLVIFSVRKNERSIINRKTILSVLLVRRSNYPFKGKWAIPGGFCKPSEDVIESAIRCLKEEANVTNKEVFLNNIYGKKDRDPRGWIISNTYNVYLTEEQVETRENCEWETAWFDIVFDIDSIRLVSNEETLELKEGNLAFDHAKIILDSIYKLRNDIRFDIRIAFEFLPDNFTLFELQNVFEAINDEKITTSNFRRDMKKYLVETNETKISGCRPAQLFTKKI